METPLACGGCIGLCMAIGHVGIECQSFLILPRRQLRAVTVATRTKVIAKSAGRASQIRIRARHGWIAVISFAGPALVDRLVGFIGAGRGGIVRFIFFRTLVDGLFRSGFITVRLFGNRRIPVASRLRGRGIRRSRFVRVTGRGFIVWGSVVCQCRQNPRLSQNHPARDTQQDAGYGGTNVPRPRRLRLRVGNR